MSLPEHRYHARSQNSEDALSDAFLQVTQGLVRVQEVLRLQERQVAQRIHEEARRQEQRAALALREAMGQVEQRLQEKDETFRILAQRMEARARKVEEWITVVEQRLIPLVGLKGTHEWRRTVELGELELRMRNLEASVQRALVSVFPRVEALVAHLEKSNPGVVLVPTSASSSPSTCVNSQVTSPSSNISLPIPSSTNLGTMSTPSLRCLSPAPNLTSNVSISSPLITNSSFPVSSGFTSGSNAIYDPSPTFDPNATFEPATSDSYATSSTNVTSGTNTTSNSSSCLPVSPNITDLRARSTANVQRKSTAARQNPITEREKAQKQRVELRMREVKIRRDNARAAPSSMGETLCSAVNIGKVNDIKRLLDSAADVNYVDTRGDSPLMLALLCTAPKVDVVDLLLQRGAEVNAVDACGQTAMHFAAALDRNWQFVSLLIGAGGDVNARNAFGATPLHWAAHRNNEAAVHVLLAAGASKTLKCWSDKWCDKTPFDVARSDVVRSLLRP